MNTCTLPDRPENFETVPSGTHKILSEKDLEICRLQDELDQIRTRCEGLEAENEWLRLGSEFTDEKRARIWEFMDDLLARWRKLDLKAPLTRRDEDVRTNTD